VNYITAAKKCLRDVPFLFALAGWDSRSRIFQITNLYTGPFLCRLVSTILYSFFNLTLSNTVSASNFRSTL
jgi:hypothetical protein